MNEKKSSCALIKEQINQRGHKALLLDTQYRHRGDSPFTKGAGIGCGELSELGGGPSEGVAGYLPDRRKEAISIMTKGLRKKIYGAL